MIALTLRLVLLLTVAAAQLTAGVSCCCLWRSDEGSINALASAFSATGSSSVGSSAGDHDSNSSERAPQCPKCAKSAAKAKKGGSSPLACAEDPSSDVCDCPKKAISSTPEAREVQAIQKPEFILGDVLWTFVQTQTQVCLPTDLLPSVSLRGWLSMICVWRI